MFKMKVMLQTVLIILSLVGRYEAANQSFPEGFLFGSASSSYQVEGAWNDNGKGESIWDVFTHNYPELIADGSNGDVACDSYHKYEEDIQLLKDLGVDFYRFSLSWTRILPTGHSHIVNPDGIAYYNRILDLLASNNITAMVTLFHWDLPQRLMSLGGLTNPMIVTYFREYARVAFENFGDRVKFWLTFNEPYQICMFGYGMRLLAPGLAMSGIGDYLCGHYLLKAHAAVYHLYNDTYRERYNGSIGITISATWFEPNTTNDEAAADKMRQFAFGIHFHPVFSSDGDYPSVVKEHIASRSANEGYSRSRLPQFTESEMRNIRGTSDFLGLNHYSSSIVSESPNPVSTETSYANDYHALSWTSTDWPRDGLGRHGAAAWGLTRLLVWLKDSYNNPDIFITENGCPDNGEIDDKVRVSYYGQYLEAVLDAIYDHNVSVKAYTAWTLMDNFEWFSGYTVKYGLYYVNFSDPLLPRIPKSSAYFYKNIVGNRTVVDYEKTQ